MIQMFNLWVLILASLAAALAYPHRIANCTGAGAGTGNWTAPTTYPTCPSVLVPIPPPSQGSESGPAHTAHVKIGILQPSESAGIMVGLGFLCFFGGVLLYAKKQGQNGPLVNKYAIC